MYTRAVYTERFDFYFEHQIIFNKKIHKLKSLLYHFHAIAASACLFDRLTLRWFLKIIFGSVYFLGSGLFESVVKSLILMQLNLFINYIVWYVFDNENVVVVCHSDRFCRLMLLQNFESSRPLLFDSNFQDTS